MFYLVDRGQGAQARLPGISATGARGWFERNRPHRARGLLKKHLETFITSGGINLSGTSHRPIIYSAVIDTRFTRSWGTRIGRGAGGFAASYGRRKAQHIVHILELVVAGKLLRRQGPTTHMTHTRTSDRWVRPGCGRADRAGHQVTCRYVNRVSKAGDMPRRMP